MKKLNFNSAQELSVDAAQLSEGKVDIGGRDIIIGFNEPSLRKARKTDVLATIDSKLNARLPLYFLPAIQIARMQKRRPRLYVVSAVNLALKWNAKSETEQKILLANNYIKLDFLRNFFEHFFPNEFSIIEYIIAQDTLKISERKLTQLLHALEIQFPTEVEKIKRVLARYKYPALFNSKTLSKKAKETLVEQEAEVEEAFRYALSHLFAMGDINFEGNYIHNPVGYVSIGGHHEETFNEVRKLALQVIKNTGELAFDRPVIFKDNLRITIQDGQGVPPPYNGFYRKSGSKFLLEEVTFENNRDILYYLDHKKLQKQFIDADKYFSLQEYSDFWKNYKSRYFDLKSRYQEGYQFTFTN